MTILTFFVSLFVILLIASLKAYDLKIGRLNFLQNIYGASDQKINQIFEFFIRRYNWVIKVSNIFIFEFLPSYLYETLVKMKDHVSKKYYESGDRFRGRRVLRSNGAVSFFLERLSDERPSSEVNKI